ncbi:HNH endonuclease [Methylobacter sp.]|uniref:HNH endonuclease n=1 Tax=Methylobacter sp. TaxID=2051955 RepID=UPI002FDED169
MSEERSRNLLDRPQAQAWFDHHPNAKAQFDIAVGFLCSKYSGDNDGYVNIGKSNPAQYRFNYKDSGYVSVCGQVGAAIVKFGTEKDSPRFEVRTKHDLVAISDFLNQHSQKYAGFKSVDGDFKQTVARAFELSDDQIQSKINNNATEPPEKTQSNVTRYARRRDVVIQCRNLAKGICGKCKHPAPFRKRSNNEPFLEVHHMIPLSKNGIDAVENTIALCPNCHREIHDIFGMNPEDE